ncbi:MAG: bifunctional 2-polyprenyl-6-hydroxyphenol methylase/3-demethylubiquinol 3-O-methyltransferase UbiG [Pseudomonadota bacterium]
MTAAEHVDPQELAKFEAMAAEWWDPTGKFKPLHMLNPCRLGYAVAQITAQHGRDPNDLTALSGLEVLDIGCGGGLLSEPMARLGANVTGIDPTARNIPVAQLHAREMGLDITYRVATAEELATEGAAFDAILNMEVIEHVPDPPGYLAAAGSLLRPGGIMISSTVSRTAKSFALAIVGAEYVLRWLPRGTHDWRRFITPEELFDMLTGAGLTPVDRKGFVFNPVLWEWQISERDLSVNYVTAAVKPAA